MGVWTCSRDGGEVRSVISLSICDLAELAPPSTSISDVPQPQKTVGRWFIIGGGVGDTVRRDVAVLHGHVCGGRCAGTHGRL